MTVHAAARLAEKDRRRRVEGFGFGSGCAVCIVFAIRFWITIAGRALSKRRLSGRSKIPSYSWGRWDVNPESNTRYARNNILYSREMEARQKQSARRLPGTSARDSNFGSLNSNK